MLISVSRLWSMVLALGLLNVVGVCVSKLEDALDLPQKRRTLKLQSPSRLGHPNATPSETW